MNLKRWVRSWNSPRRALNDCRRLDVKPGSCWRSGCWAGSLAVHASLNSPSFSKCNKRPVSMSAIKSSSLFSNVNTVAGTWLDFQCLAFSRWAGLDVQSCPRDSATSGATQGQLTGRSAFFISRKVRISLRQAAKRLSTNACCCAEADQDDDSQLHPAVF